MFVRSVDECWIADVEAEGKVAMAWDVIESKLCCLCGVKNTYALMSPQIDHLNCLPRCQHNANLLKVELEVLVVDFLPIDDQSDYVTV